ncbi:MAG: dienelactone hydrolase family protein [Bryobacterales bacterium]|nr:dienelactone hydrolase family protein [Bryobacterales bacterium]
MLDVSRRRFLGASAAASGLGVPVLCAQDWARQAVDRSPRKREWMTVKHGARAVESMVAYPQSQEKAPAMVVIHEIFGMTDWVENVTDEFAEAGFLAVAPDLLSGMAPGGGRTKDLPASEVGQVIRALPPDQITADLNAVADYIRKLPACNGRVCVVGFSWGGAHAFQFATNRKDLAAAFVFYGNGPEAAAIPRIQAPVYGFYAGNDARINATIPETQAQMKAAGKRYETVVYEGATHGFMRAGAQPDATEANRKARAAAWARLKELRPSFR